MLLTIFTIAALVFSAILHEYAHGWAAYKLGDDTAKDAGRLTLNPIAHLDPIGSVLVPLLLVLSRVGLIIAWAKPVPYNPYNLKDQKFGDLKVALAGPITNFMIAIVFGLVARFSPLELAIKQGIVASFFSGDYAAILGQLSGSFAASIYVLAIILCFINLLLAIFNLIPVPPLDGSKILVTFLPQRLRLGYYRLEPYGIIIILALLWFGFLNFLISGLLSLLFTYIVGI